MIRFIGHSFLGLLLIAGCHERKLATTAPTSTGQPPIEVPRTESPAGEREEAGQQAEIGECGIERWAVKLGYDDAARTVDVENPQLTTIDALRALLPPQYLKTSPRTSPTEMTVFRLDDVSLRWYMREADGDYHMVIVDEHGDTMIAEIPALDCIRQNSPWREVIGRARSAAQARLHHVTSRRQSVEEVISIVGVGFFDVIHGQRGVAPNGIELHPVIGICFGRGCAPMRESPQE